MAIINTLQKCLDSPYLFTDAEAPDRVAGLLLLARQRLDAANQIHSGGQGDAADVGSLGYEAMFAAIRALVYAKGYREVGLKCLVLAVEQLYVRPGLLDVALIHAFERAQGLRLAPAELLQAAGALVVRAEGLVGV